jgi:hypothetical protein
VFWVLLLCAFTEVIVMDMQILNRVCDLYSSGATVKAIALDVGISTRMIWLYLGKARDMGDPRARHRRVVGAGIVNVLRDAFEAADGGFLGWEDFRQLLWAGQDVPATWRVIVRVGVSDCRKRFGLEIVSDRKMNGYRLVR